MKVFTYNPRIERMAEEAATRKKHDNPQSRVTNMTKQMMLRPFFYQRDMISKMINFWSYFYTPTYEVSVQEVTKAPSIVKGNVM